MAKTFGIAAAALAMLFGLSGVANACDPTYMTRLGEVVHVIIWPDPLHHPCTINKQGTVSASPCPEKKARAEYAHRDSKAFQRYARRFHVSADEPAYHYICLERGPDGRWRDAPNYRP
jgi:hypothetical protein